MIAPHLLSPPPPRSASPSPRRTPDPVTHWPAKVTLKAAGGHTAEIGVLTLRRRGDLLDLVLSIMPHTEQARRVSVEAFVGDSPSAISLVDNAGRKRYLTVPDSANRPSRTQDPALEVGEISMRTYTFPAPGPEVTAMDVSIGGAPPLRNVPVTP
ncbi:hypothetical protein AB0C28_48090 [Nonomuraea sp. NPDC048892]|uniref:hypothetical protein n=1 Tax=Nonomuraea sp. NPDC048892 TaxID=3154624 RepID=UPI0033D753D0